VCFVCVRETGWSQSYLLFCDEEQDASKLAPFFMLRLKEERGMRKKVCVSVGRMRERERETYFGHC